MLHRRTCHTAFCLFVGLLLLPGAHLSAQGCEVLLDDSFSVSDSLLEPRPNIPTDVPSTCASCGGGYTCTEGENGQQTPNEYNIHSIEPDEGDRCIQVRLTSLCAGGGVGNTNLASGAWLFPFSPQGDKCDATKIGSVCANSP